LNELSECPKNGSSGHAFPGLKNAAQGRGGPGTEHPLRPKSRAAPERVGFDLAVRITSGWVPEGEQSPRAGGRQGEYVIRARSTGCQHLFREI